MIVLIVIWLILGILSVLLTFNSCRKEWYVNFGTEYWNNECETALHLLLFISPIFILGGLLSFVIFITQIPKEHQCFWFRISKD